MTNTPDPDEQYIDEELADMIEGVRPSVRRRKANEKRSRAWREAYPLAAAIGALVITAAVSGLLTLAVTHDECSEDPDRMGRLQKEACIERFTNK